MTAPSSKTRMPNERLCSHPKRRGLVGFSPPAIATSAQQMTDNGPLSTSSRLDPHALPKRYAILNLRGCRFRLRVIPRGVVVLNAIDFHVVIVRDALPRTLRSM